MESDFTCISSITWPQNLIAEGWHFLEDVGREELEAVVLYAGIIQYQNFNVSHLYIPKQVAFRTSRGLGYEVDFEELKKLDDWLYTNQLDLLIQVHTHPGVAYHSPADDQQAIVTQFGSISIVVPNFARDPFSISNCAIYRFEKSCEWVKVTNEDKLLFKIV